jgi:four helix bundle protein
MAMGSASELECCLQLARDLQLLDPPEYGSLQESVTELKRMLTSLIRKVRAQGADGS